MIEEFKSISEINTDLVEGKLLIMAMAILTTIDYEDIKKNEYGCGSHPDVVLAKIVELTNKVYYEDEWKSSEVKRNRDVKINKILESLNFRNSYPNK